MSAPLEQKIPHHELNDAVPERPPLAILGESTDSSGSSSTLTGVTSPTLSNASDPASFYRPASSLTAISNFYPHLPQKSPSHETKAMSRRPRPSTAPTAGDSPASRPPLFPSQPTFYYDAKTGDEPPVLGYSISRGRSPGSQHDIKSTPVHGQSRASSARSRLLPASVDLKREPSQDFDVVASSSTISSAAQSPDRTRGTLQASDFGSMVDLPSTSDPDASPRDWHSFVRAYSNGLWDPFKTPLPPIPVTRTNSVRNKPSSPNHPRVGSSLRRAATTQAGEAHAGKPVPSRIELPSRPNLQPVSPPWRSPALPYIISANRVGRARSPSVPSSPSIAQRRGAGTPDLRRSSAFDEVVHGRRHNNSIHSSGDLVRSTIYPPDLDPPGHIVSTSDADALRTVDEDTSSTASIQHAATMRWAGAGVDVAPLSLPSPELELTDPMRRVSLNAAGNHSPSNSTNERPSRIPRQGKTRTSMYDKSSFASKPGTPLEAIQGSPSHSPNEWPVPTSCKTNSPTDSPSNAMKSPFEKRKSVDVGYFPQFSASRVSPGTATTYHSFASSVPVGMHKGALETNDYFGMVNTSSSGSASPFSARSNVVQARTPDLRRSSTAMPHVNEVQATSVTVDFDIAASAISACGDPTDTMEVIGVASNWEPGSDSSETQFRETGYLSAPMPPDESRRLQALYRLNIIHTAKDVNFDRICHLGKLVFNTKIVMVSLVDAKTQFHKAETGMGFALADRAVSFCSHAILQRTDEPLVILDASKDWRFAKNPLVTGKPNIRFYAGAPLRTAEGYNVGSLCIIDDEPRTECSPRTRHTLKEFAAIVMRELELWRDKIQLRIRDRIQTSMELFTRSCLEMDGSPEDHPGSPETKMQQVYGEAATLVRKTLDVDGAIILDVSNFEAIETLDTDGTRRRFYHGDLYDAAPPGVSADHSYRRFMATGRSHAFGPLPALPILGADEDVTNPRQRSPIGGDDHEGLSNFLSTWPEGKLFDRVPGVFKKVMPRDIQYAMIVPVFNVDRRPFLLICAYTMKNTQHYLEGFELQYLRAVGVIIMSAVLKRRMVLADTAKSLFISNISHELRTPLHGILASSELLRDTRLTNGQAAYLSTVQACAQSLVETVNHVLDFTKLSGSTQDNGRTLPSHLTKFDLKCLVDETVEGCWLGAQPRGASGVEEIGSVYSPPVPPEKNSGVSLEDKATAFVETVADIGLREKGWWVSSDRGGIRRILMNLMGNSIKFTNDGFIRIRLREIPKDVVNGSLTVELAVFDTGKGISKDFLQNRIFQPFSQENPLQTGTGLGLAIVNSIGNTLGGKVEVWSAEGVGTEIRVIFEAEQATISDHRFLASPDEPINVKMVGFDSEHRGVRLLRDTMTAYLVEWWHFVLVPDGQASTPVNILFVNEDIDCVKALIEAQDVGLPMIMLSHARGNSALLAALNVFEEMGGWYQLVFKPAGPVRLEEAFKNAMEHLDRLDGSSPSSADKSPSYRTLDRPTTSLISEEEGALDSTTAASTNRHLAPGVLPSHLGRRKSEEVIEETKRPSIGTRSSTYNGNPIRDEAQADVSSDSVRNVAPVPASPTSPINSAVPIADDGSVILKSVVGAASGLKKLVVLLVDDNAINRNLLAHWLKKKGFEFRQASDGEEAVNAFKDHPAQFFDVILMDLSMPRMNGFEAARAIREIERQRRRPEFRSGNPEVKGEMKVGSKIFALTGLATMEDKRRAFTAGVDGYLIKPVSLKTLENVFEQLSNPS